jgi:REP element-mobilizing transposase RayT
MRETQTELFSKPVKRRFFGGALLRGKRKTQRPLTTREAMHFVLRSQYAGGDYSFRKFKNLKVIERILEQAARKYGVKIYRQAIQSNHIHLILKITSRRLYRSFIAVIAGKIASHVMEGQSFKNFYRFLRAKALAKPAKPPIKGQAFWENRPFHRIIHWGKDYLGACRYLLKNRLEALGFIAYTPRKKSAAYGSANAYLQVKL